MKERCDKGLITIPICYYFKGIFFLFLEIDQIHTHTSLHPIFLNLEFYININQLMR